MCEMRFNPYERGLENVARRNVGEYRGGGCNGDDGGGMRKRSVREIRMMNDRAPANTGPFDRAWKIGKLAWSVVSSGKMKRRADSEPSRDTESGDLARLGNGACAATTDLL